MWMAIPSSLLGKGPWKKNLPKFGHSLVVSHQLFWLNAYTGSNFADKSNFFLSQLLLLLLFLFRMDQCSEKWADNISVVDLWKKSKASSFLLGWKSWVHLKKCYTFFDTSNERNKEVIHQTKLLLKKALELISKGLIAILSFCDIQNQSGKQCIKQLIHKLKTLFLKDSFNFHAILTYLI